MSDELTALNKQAILAAKQHMNHVCWPTVGLVLFVLAGFVTTLSLYATGMVSPWLAGLLIAILTYMSYTPLHEAAHGNINNSRDDLKWLNDLCGYLMAPFIMVPYASHKLEHFTHHRHTNQEGKDPDFVVSGISKGPIAAIITVIQFLWVQNTFFVRQHWDKANLRERSVYAAELGFSWGWRIAFIAYLGHWEALAVVGLGYFAGGFFTAYWFAYRPHIPYQDPTRYRNTNSLIMPRWMKPFEWFWLGQNLHSIHHLFPRVPFYRYHALHREIEPVMRAHGTPIVGIFSREPVSTS